MSKRVTIPLGDSALELLLPDGAAVLRSEDATPLANAEAEVARVLRHPAGAPPLAETVRRMKPRTVVVTISDITRPVPNRALLRPLLALLNQCGVADDQVTLVVGTGMHRPSSDEELQQMVGGQLLSRLAVESHTADRPETLVRINDDPPVSVNRRFAEADLRVVTGLIEPHFMAGFSGGRKGIIPALADLETVRRFHSFETLDHPLAANGVLHGNPCHGIALDLARRVGADFLLNMAINRARQVCGVFGGDLEAAHQRGCERVAALTRARVRAPADLVITSAGGAPLDRTFYQTVKGMVCALPALAPGGTLLQVAGCAEGLGSPAYTELMLRWGDDWRGFVADRQANPRETLLDQWELQMQCKVLARTGRARLLLASDGMPLDLQRRIGVTPCPGDGDAETRAQRFVDGYLQTHPGASVAVIPEGPYTMLEG